MDINVLGPLTAREDGVSITPTAAKPRKVLAMLAVYANEIVPVTMLFEELWGEDIPRSATTTLQTYVFHLRNLIGLVCDDPKDVLQTQPGGYLLRTGDGTVDALEFERLAAGGHRAREAGDFRGAAEKFREALGCWNGAALVDVQQGDVLEVEAQRLNEARLSVLDRRIDADLRLGRHHEMVSELTALVARNRTHEGLCAHLMVALYRSGRRGEAADVYRRMRASLVNELGLEPSPALHRLQRLVLAGDQNLAAADDADWLLNVG
uniref:Putative SARP family protein n=1 Tax=uncultured bacterium esnapd4 TaxID=1366610 RepID=S5TKI3_9BACT|nr:putative SARP family protein [uncultured bacterium esnapd4]QEO75011.1 omn36 [uncultured bacterium]